MAFIAMIQQSVTTFLTKINRLSLTCLVLEGSSPLPCHGHERFCGPGYFLQ